MRRSSFSSQRNRRASMQQQRDPEPSRALVWAALAYDQLVFRGEQVLSANPYGPLKERLKASVHVPNLQVD
jgi:hypothetical protein